MDGFFTQRDSLIHAFLYASAIILTPILTQIQTPYCAQNPQKILKQIRMHSLKD
jgi:hypothetical protein